MNESTTITIDNIVQLIEGIAKAEYQRGYVAGLEEKRLTEKYWGKERNLKASKSRSLTISMIQEDKTE